MTRMSSDYADNELELFRKIVSFVYVIFRILRFFLQMSSSSTGCILTLEQIIFTPIYILLCFQMDLVTESENGTASSTDILNCGDALLSKKLKKKETEQVLNKFVQNKWLIEVCFSERQYQLILLKPF